MEESGLRENCTIRLIERTEEGKGRPPSTLHGGALDTNGRAEPKEVEVNESY